MDWLALAAVAGLLPVELAAEVDAASLPVDPFPAQAEELVSSETRGEASEYEVDELWWCGGEEGTGLVRFEEPRRSPRWLEVDELVPAAAAMPCAARCP